MNRAWWIRAGILTSVIAASIAISLVPIDTAPPRGERSTVVQAVDLSRFSPNRLDATLRLLFVHHSCGGQLLADRGPESGEHCIYETHQNGGGLRRLLEADGYEVHEASYGSLIGESTDVFDWLPKFRDQMEQVLRVDEQDRFYEDERRNQIVVFKSCYPNNMFVGPGQEPGSSSGPELTVANAKAAYAALLPELAKYPDVLFVAVTAPPVAGPPASRPLWKVLARKVLGRDRAPSGPHARAFNSWLVAAEGWLAGYEAKNVAVFDYYDVLTRHGASDYSMYSTGNGFDSHPSSEGNTEAAAAFVPFLNRAVRRHRSKE